MQFFALPLQRFTNQTAITPFAQLYLPDMLLTIQVHEKFLSISGTAIKSN